MYTSTRVHADSQFTSHSLPDLTSTLIFSFTKLREDFMHLVTIFLELKFASSGDPITWTVYCVPSVKEYISTTHINPSYKGSLKLVLGALHWLIYHIYIHHPAYIRYISKVDKKRGM